MILKNPELGQKFWRAIGQSNSKENKFHFAIDVPTALCLLSSVTHEQFSKKGGQVKSDAKKKAAQRNWKKALKALKEKRAKLKKTTP